MGASSTSARAYPSSASGLPSPAGVQRARHRRVGPRRPTTWGTGWRQRRVCLCLWQCPAEAVPTPEQPPARLRHRRDLAGAIAPGPGPPPPGWGTPAPCTPCERVHLANSTALTEDWPPLAAARGGGAVVVVARLATPSLGEPACRRPWRRRGQRQRRQRAASRAQPSSGGRSGRKQGNMCAGLVTAGERRPTLIWSHPGKPRCADPPRQVPGPRRRRSHRYPRRGPALDTTTAWGAHTVTADYRAVPQVFFCDPPAGAVGLTTDQAERAGYRARVVDVDVGQKLIGASLYADNNTGRARMVMTGWWLLASGPP